MRTRFLLSTFSLLLVIASFATTSLAQSSGNGNSWGKGGSPKPTPTPSPTPGPVIDPDGTWIHSGNSNWSTTGNWSGGIVADGGGFANFSTINITVDTNVSLDGGTSRTVRRIDIGDNNNTNNYTISASAGASLIFDNTANSANAQLNQTATSAGDTIAAPVLLNSSLDITNASANTLTISGTIQSNSAGTKTVTTSNGAVLLSGVISDGSSGNVAVVQNGSGTLTLNKANTFTGGVTVKAGTVTGTSQATAFGAGTITLGDTSGSANATVLGDGRTFANAITVAAGSSGTLTLGNNGGGSNTVFSGAVTLNNDLTLTASGTGSVKLTGGVTGTGDIFLNNTTASNVNFLDTTLVNNTGTITNSSSGSGSSTMTAKLGGNVTQVIQNSSTSVLILNMATNTAFVGSLAVNAGTVQLGTASALNSANVVSVASGATFDINAQNQTIAGLDGGTGTVTNSGGAKTLTLGGSGTYTFGGVITATDANHNDMIIVKSGAGTQTLTGASLYNGGTTVSGGTLFANNTTGSATGPGAVTVTNAGTVLGGTGFIGGDVTVNANAILEGGTGSTGQTLTLQKNLTMNANSIIELALGPGLTHSTLARTGTGTWSFQSTQKFTFILNPGTTTGFYNNIITGLASDPGTEGTWSITNAGFIATFSYDGGAGPGNIDLNVTAVPEPSTYFAAALALLALVYFQRQRLAQTFKRRTVLAAS